MNLLQQSTSLVKNFPIHTPRASTIKKLLMVNSAIYAAYLLSSGPAKLAHKSHFTASPTTSFESLFLYHFSHTSLLQFLFTSGVFYTVGNYHVAAYGCSHFLTLFGASALGGSLLTGLGLKSGRTDIYQAGAMAPAAGLIAYNVFRNPGWFKVFLRPVPLLAVLALYGAFYNDRSAIGGIGAGYLAFVFGI